MNQSDKPKEPPEAPSLESPVSRLSSSVSFLTDRNACRSAPPDVSVSILDGDWNHRIHKRKRHRGSSASSSPAAQGTAGEKAGQPRHKTSTRLMRLIAKLLR